MFFALCIARFNVHAVCCALQVARCALRVALFFYFAKRKKSSAAKEEAAQKETEAAAEGEEGKINLGRKDEATANRT